MDQVKLFSKSYKVCEECGTKCAYEGHISGPCWGTVTAEDIAGEGLLHTCEGHTNLFSIFPDLAKYIPEPEVQHAED